MILEIRDEVITLSGTLVKNQWAALESAIVLRLRQHPAGVILDLANLTQVTTDGAQTFKEAAAHVARVAPKARLVLVNVPSGVQRVLRQSGGIGSSLAIGTTLTEARASLQAAEAVMGHGMVEVGEISQNGVRPAGSKLEAAPVVLVGLLGTPADEHAVAVACRLAATIPSEAVTHEVTARMHLAYILTVPRDRSLLDPLGAEEEKAAKQLRQFGASVKATGCVAAAITQIERTRDGGIRLTDLAGDLRASFLVLALSVNASSEQIDMARYVVEKAPCEVIVNRVPLASLRAGEASDPGTKEKENGH